MQNLEKNLKRKVPTNNKTIIMQNNHKKVLRKSNIEKKKMQKALCNKKLC